MNATDQFFPVVQFIMIYKVVLTFKSMDEILKCDHSKESHWAILNWGAVYNAAQGVSYFSFESVNEIQWFARSNENYWRKVSDSPSQSVCSMPYKVRVFLIYKLR